MSLHDVMNNVEYISMPFENTGTSLMINDCVLNTLYTYPLQKQLFFVTNFLVAINTVSTTPPPPGAPTESGHERDLVT